MNKTAMHTTNDAIPLGSFLFHGPATHTVFIQKLQGKGAGEERNKKTTALTIPKVLAELVGEAVDGGLEGDPQLLTQHNVRRGVGLPTEAAHCCRLQLEVLLYGLSDRLQQH